MESTKALNPKALEAAIRAYDETILNDELGDAKHVVRAYLTALAAQGEAAQPAAEGWVDWPGLKQPVDDDTVIEFLADDGVIERRLARYMRWELPFKYRLPASPNAASQDGGRDRE